MIIKYAILVQLYIHSVDMNTIMKSSIKTILGQQLPQKFHRACKNRAYGHKLHHVIILILEYSIYTILKPDKL